MLPDLAPALTEGGFVSGEWTFAVSPCLYQEPAKKDPARRARKRAAVNRYFIFPKYSSTAFSCSELPLSKLRGIECHSVLD
jgi:hypothetical protein